MALIQAFVRFDPDRAPEQAAFRVKARALLAPLEWRALLLPRGTVTRWQTITTLCVDCEMPPSQLH